MNKLKILELIEDKVKKTPNNVCIFDGKKNISYIEFWKECISFSNTIISHGTKPIVAIIESRSCFDYVAMIGTLFAGGTYIPINSKTPQNKIKEIIHITDSNFIVNENHYIKLKPKKNFKVINYANIIKSNNLILKNKHNLKNAYIIFTSGTTGKPKGVKISKESLTHYVIWICLYIKLKENINCSQIPSIGFDLSVADIYLSLCSGGKLIIADNQLNYIFPGRFIKENNINHLTCTPTLINLISNSKQLNKKYLKSLNTIFFCGEPLHVKQIEKIFKANSNINIINSYGPTEATVSMTSIILTKKNYTNFNHKYISLGKTIKNMNISFFENNKMNNLKGEILISGPQLSSGYLKDKNNDKKKYITMKGVRYYFTGDFGYRDGSNYYFDKREDNQVKINGYRIELEEINNIFRKLGYTNVYTLVVDRYLTTYLESKKNNIKIIRDKLSKHIEKYKIPDRIITIKNFPINKNGKIDYKKILKK